MSSKRQRTMKCSAGFNSVSIPVWFGGLCVVSEEWSKSGINPKHFFSTQFLFLFLLFPPLLLHSTLLPLSSFSWPYLFTAPCSIVLFLCAPPLYPMLLLLHSGFLLPLLDFIFSCNFDLMHLSPPCSRLSSFILS